MSRRIRSGFTLVELLVVITIIGILAGLLFPAIQAMRNSARQTECLNNITQVGKAALAFEAAKQRFPAYKNLRPGFPSTNDTNVYLVGWVPPVLSYLGRNDLYNMYSDVNILGQGVSPDPRKAWPPVDDTGKHYRVAILVCPADTDQAVDAEIQFVINGGMVDNVANLKKPNPLAPDYLENGISFDNTAANQVKSSISYVSSKDGVATTIMYSENADADRDNSLGAMTGWDGFVAHTNPDTAQQTWKDDGYEALNCLMWYNTAKNDPAPKVPLNKDLENTSGIEPEHFARPFSAHSGGFNVFFCGGNARFITEEISYDLYKALLSADGKNGRDPSVGAPNPPNKGTAITHTDPISESQLDQ